MHLQDTEFLNQLIHSSGDQWLNAVRVQQYMLGVYSCSNGRWYPRQLELSMERLSKEAPDAPGGKSW